MSCRTSDLSPKVIFFDLGQTLVTGAEQSSRRLLGSRLRLTEKETSRLGKFIMTFWCTEPGPLVKALREILPAKDSSWLREVVEQVWREQMECVREIPGALRLLRFLKAKGCGVGIISNTWHPFYEGFCRICPEINELVDYRFLSYREGIKKPSPDFYRKAIDAVAGGHAANCWMVGDSYELDMEPALRAGMHAVWVLSTVEREKELLVQVLEGKKPRPEWMAGDLDEVLQFMEGRF